MSFAGCVVIPGSEVFNVVRLSPPPEPGRAKKIAVNAIAPNRNAIGTDMVRMGATAVPVLVASAVEMNARTNGRFLTVRVTRLMSIAGPS